MLALALGGRTVAEWKASMSAVEFQAWVDFYRLQPFDDLHRYHRPAALVATGLGGGDVADALRWLEDGPVSPAMPIDGSAPHYTDADRATLQAFGMLKKG